MLIPIFILLLSFFFFDIIITYHIQLYFIFIVYLCMLFLKTGRFSNSLYLLFFIVIFFWGYSLSINFSLNFSVIYYYITI